MASFASLSSVGYVKFHSEMTDPSGEAAVKMDLQHGKFRLEEQQRERQLRQELSKRFFVIVVLLLALLAASVVCAVVFGALYFSAASVDNVETHAELTELHRTTIPCPSSHPWAIDNGTKCSTHRRADQDLGVYVTSAERNTECSPRKEANAVCVDYSGSCFVVSPQRLNHSQAVSYCQTRSGFVPWRPRDSQEMVNVTAKFMRDDNSGNMFWLDLSVRDSVVPNPGGLCSGPACSALYTWGDGSSAFDASDAGLSVWRSTESACFAFFASDRIIHDEDCEESFSVVCAAVCEHAS